MDIVQSCQFPSAKLIGRQLIRNQNYSLDLPKPLHTLPDLPDLKFKSTLHKPYQNSTKHNIFPLWYPKHPPFSKVVPPRQVKLGRLSLMTFINPNDLVPKPLIIVGINYRCLNGFWLILQLNTWPLQFPFTRLTGRKFIDTKTRVLTSLRPWPHFPSCQTLNSQTISQVDSTTIFYPSWFLKHTMSESEVSIHPFQTIKNCH